LYKTRSGTSSQCSAVQYASAAYAVMRCLSVFLSRLCILSKRKKNKSSFFSPSGSLPAKLLNRLQAVINTAARLVCHAMKADHITPVLKDLHWLRIQERIQYKLSCVLVFKCQHSLAPPYLSDQLQQVARMEPRQRLRSSSPALVVPPTRRSSLGD